MTTITINRATVEQALEALTAHADLHGTMYLKMDAITALKAALAQQAEPVYWEVRCTAHPKWMRVDEQQFDEYVAHGWEGQRLYTAPPRQAEPVEPVAWLYEAGTDRTLHWYKPPLHGTPLYTAPPQRKPLTEEEIAAEWQKASECASKSEAAVTTSQFVQMFARAIERAHGIKE